MKNIYKVFLTILLTIFIPFAAKAANGIDNVKYENEAVMISGAVDAGTEYVTIVITNPMKERGPLDNDASVSGKDIFQFVGKAECDSDGSFSEKIYIRKDEATDAIQSGLYFVYVITDTNEYSGSFLIMTEEGKDSIVSEFEADTIDLDSLLNKYVTEQPVLSIVLDEYYANNKAVIESNFLKYRTNEYEGEFGTGSAGIENIESVYANAVLLSKINQSSDLGSLLPEIAQKNNLTLNEDYEKYKALVLEKLVSLKGDGFESVAKFADLYILASINTYDDRSAIDRLVALYYDEVGIDLDKYQSYTTPTIGSALMHKDFADFAAVCTAVQNRMGVLDAEKEQEEQEEQEEREEHNNSSGNRGSTTGGSVIIPRPPVQVVPIPDDEDDYSHNFDDLTNFEWAEEAISYLNNKNIITGTTENTYEPHREVTRAEFTTMVVRALELEIILGINKPKFTDVKDEWYEDYVTIAAMHGFINGYDDGSFGPNDNISRQDMAVIISKALVGVEGNIIEKIFKDNDMISDYAQNAVKKCVDCDIIQGDNNSMFNPRNNATRAEAACVIYRLLEKIGDE